MKKMCIIGSLNIDVTTSVARLPKVGESVPAKSFKIFIGGGKGANQAFALGRLGADVMMIGKVGERFYGPDYLEVLRKNNVDVTGIAIEKDTDCGVAVIAVDEKGDNTLAVYPGANGKVDINYIDSRWDLIKKRDIFLLQMEIPIEANLHVLKRLKEAGKTVILDPAPANPIPVEAYSCVDYITPNETELQAHTGMPTDSEEEILAASRELIRKSAKNVIVKAGKRGAYLVDKDNFRHIEGYKVKAVDTTAAGDSFNAGFAYALSEDMDIIEAIKFANAVGGLSTTAMGAQSAMPAIDEVNKFLSQNR